MIRAWSFLNSLHFHIDQKEELEIVVEIAGKSTRLKNACSWLCDWLLNWLFGHFSGTLYMDSKASNILKDEGDVNGRYNPPLLNL